MKIPYKFFWLSLIILFIAVFAPVDGKAGGTGFDKIAHTLLFAFVSINTCFYFIHNKNLFIPIILIVGSLSYITEFIQSFIPMRQFENLDILADCIGVVLGIILFVVFRKLFIKAYKLLGETPAYQNKNY